MARSLATGPMYVPYAAGSPWFTSLAIAGMSLATNASCTESTTIAREQAEHFWPPKPNALCATPSAAASRSASSSMMMPSLPPISATTRLSHFWPGCTSAASLLMPMPTSLEPVNDTNRVLACRTI